MIGGLGLLLLVTIFSFVYPAGEQKAFSVATTGKVDSSGDVQGANEQIDDAFIARWRERYPTVCTTTNVIPSEGNPQTVENPYNEYALVEHWDETPNKYHLVSQELVGHASTGTTTLVANMLALVPQKDIWPGNALVAWSLPKTGGKLFFTSHRLSSDAPFSDFYSYDLHTGVVAFLPNASIYGPEWPWVISSDGFRFLSAYCRAESPEFFGRRLYVVDLWTDTARLVKTLPPGETLMEGISGFDGSSVEGKKEWLNNSTIQFTVYKESKTEDENQVLRVETLNI